MRNRIISLIKDSFINDECVFALWLEGSDGLGRTDEYSDIDIWLDVEDGQEERTLDICEKALQTISDIDFIDNYDHPHPKIFQRNIHLKDTSEYLLIDICVQSHSRGSEGCTFVKGDVAEYPLVLFDKCDIIKIIEPPEPDKENISKTYSDCRDIYLQRSRLIKYILRNQFLEACAYYDKYVRQPIICLYRLIYTPRHSEYMLVHISDHLPKDIIGQLEKLYMIRTIDDIKNNLILADKLYAAAVEQTNKMYAL